MAQALIEMMEIQDEKKMTMTDLEIQEVGTLTLLQCLYNETKIDALRDFVDFYCQFKVSKNRLGRREIANAISMGALGADDRRKRSSIKDLFGGMRS